MPNFAANLSMMFQEVEFLDRFGAAAKAGFNAVEFLFPYAFDAQVLAARLRQHGLEQVLFNLPPGDWEAGDRGLASLPGRETDFMQALERALDYADVLDCPRVHAMAGLVPAGGSAEAHRATYVSNLRNAAKRAAERGKTVLIEPINNRDIPGYFLNYPAQAQAVIEEVDSPNLKLQFDLYHCQIMCGDLATNIHQYLPLTDHMQIAGVPERHEPDVGEINYPYLFRLLDELGYRGWIGCEYRPATETAAGLSWAKPYLTRDPGKSP